MTIKFNKNATLYIPANYDKLSDDDKSRICNGVGSKRFAFIPESIIGVSIHEPANIHDYMYFVGKNLWEKGFADRMFLYNMLVVIQEKESRLNGVRKRVAFLYYQAVRGFGTPAFFSK